MNRTLAKSMIIHFRNVLINSIAGSEIFPISFRRIIYKLCGNHVSNAKIFSHCYLGGKGLFIGENSFVNHECFFDLSAPIYIGKNCNIGMRCCFLTGTHEFGDFSRRAISIIKQPVNIGSGVWIGANVTILPGCTIGDGCIIAAGAVVTKDCEFNGLYMGVPAKRVRDLDE